VAEGFTINITGIPELQAKLEVVSAEIKTVLADSLETAGIMVESDAKRRVHVITGRLRDSIREINKIDSGDKIEVQIGSDVPYAEQEEFRVGGKYPGSHAYLRPALDENEQKLIDVIESKILAAIEAFK